MNRNKFKNYVTWNLLKCQSTTIKTSKLIKINPNKFKVKGYIHGIY